MRVKRKVFNLGLFYLTILISFNYASLALAGEFTVFGPQDYIRSTGSPERVTSNFSVLNPNTESFLRVYNGGLQGQEAELVSSAIISINGTQVLGPEKFNQTVKFLEVPVNLQSDNKLDVEVRAKPGGFLTLKILGIDNVAPNIQIIQPQDGSLTNINLYNIKLSFNDDISGLNPNSFKVTINDIDKTNLFNVITTGLFGSASANLLLSEGTNIIKASIYMKHFKSDLVCFI